MSDDQPQQSDEVRKVPVAWEALEDAFENNAPEVHSYLNVETGDVIRVVDGVADPGMHARISHDPTYMLVDPVSSREQYRWMERYIATVEDGTFQQRLVSAIDGKGAFRRFKDVLMNHPLDRERWFTFRSERLRAAMEAWLTAHGIEAVERQKWEVPSVDAVAPQPHKPPRPQAAAGRPDGGDASGADATRLRLRDTITQLPDDQVGLALEFCQFLLQRGRAAAEPSDGAATPDVDGAKDR